MMEKTKSNLQSKVLYEKPELKRAEKMVFMFEPYKTGVSKVACRQCSGCHGCR
jgi:hypothetical protein